MTYLMRFVSRMKRILLYGGLEREQYQMISSDINESNRHTLVIISAACAVFYFARLYIIPTTVAPFNRNLYIGAIFFFTVLALFNHFVRGNRYLIHCSAYLFLITYLCTGAFAAVGPAGVQERTTLFLVFITAAPMLYALNAAELISIILPEELFYLALISNYQSMYPVYQTNVTNSIFFTTAALLLGVYMSNMKISGIYNAYKNARLEKIQELNEQLHKSQEELHTALLSAEQANQAKTTFLNNMSHDIRTPMNAILGFAALAQKHIDEPARVSDALKKISVSGEHLLSLINDVLDMSRIESGKMTLHPQPLSLSELINELEVITRIDAQAKQLDYSTAIDIRQDYVLADKLRLNQILLNIVSNAIKFTPNGGSVSLKLTEQDSVYTFRIKDTGIGMTKEFQQHIFESFAREEHAVKTIQGTGLGMSITKRLVDLMHGSITVDSTVGIGSEFIVSLHLPYSQAPAVSAESDSAEKAYMLSGTHILLAEDNALNLELTQTILQENGFSVDIAKDGAIAVQKMRDAAHGQYDIILMDIQMPNMNGYEAARAIRAMDDKEKANIPIIAMTANAFEEDIKHSLESGMNGHLSKPLDANKLLDTLCTFLC